MMSMIKVISELACNEFNEFDMEPLILTLRPNASYKKLLNHLNQILLSIV